MKATLDDSPIGQHDECSSLFVLATLGDADAASQLYSRCVPPLRAWLASRVDYGLAEDIAHEALVVAFRKSTSFRAGATFMPWLRVIAWRLAQKALRHDARRHSWEHEFYEAGRIHAGPATGSDDRQRAALDACLSTLPEHQFQLIHSRYYAGKSCEEIAAEQGRKRVAVAVNLHRIFKSLRQEIERHVQRCESSPPRGDSLNGPVKTRLTSCDPPLIKP
jgi:RNA polymerase sigma-70 factor, ECF subfamily